MFVTKRSNCMSDILQFPTTIVSYICEPEEGWCGQPKYCYNKTIHVALISFAVVFGLLVFGYVFFSFPLSLYSDNG